MKSHPFTVNKTSWLALALLLLTAVEWTVRGPVRSLRSSPEYNDFLSPYVQTKVWLSGKNPYDLSALIRAWPYQNAGLEQNLISRGIPSPYPIVGFPLLAPLAASSWLHANLLWQLTEIFFFAVFMAALLSLARDREENSAYLLVPATLAFAPFHTGLAVENVALVALALATLAVACERRFPLLTGILLACGLALKPTVAVPAFAYLSIRQRWCSILTSVAACVVLLAAAAARLTLSGTGWFPDYLHNGKHLFDPGTIYDFSNANSLRFDLVNAQVIFSQFMTRSLAQYLATGIAGLALLAWVTLRRRGSVDQPLLDLSVLSVVALVPLYHRFYDAALLTFPIAWAITSRRGAAARPARIILIAAIPFLIPGAALLRSVKQSNAMIATLSKTWWWNVFVAAHQAWLVLVILIALLFAVRKLSQPKPKVSLVEIASVAA